MVENGVIRVIRMTDEKRFVNDIDNGKLYDTKGEMYTIYYDDRVDFYSLWEFLNKLNDENEQLKQRISELKEDNDHKFWKLQFMHQFNTTQLIVHEIGRAIDKGYEVSDKFKEYLDELKEHNEKGRKKAIEQEEW